MKNNIEYWLKDNKNNYVQLPVNPDGLKINSGFSVESYDNLALRTYTSAGVRSPRTLSLSSFFPHHYNPSYCEYDGFMKPSEFADMIEMWRDRRLNVRLIVTGTSISIPVFIESFEYEVEPFAMHKEIQYSISMTEYVHPLSTSVSSMTMEGLKALREPMPPKKRPKKHTVQEGDTLFSISVQYYGDGSMVGKLFDLNRKLLKNDFNGLKKGMRLLIPFEAQRI